MIKTHEKFLFQDEEKQNQFFCEVNWNQKDEKTNECKIVRFIFPDGKESYVKREHLNAMLFSISKPEDQRKLVPKKEITVKWYETTVGVKAKRDIAKGEQITFPIKISLPVSGEEYYGDIRKH